MQREETDIKPLKEYSSGVFQLEGSRDGVTPSSGQAVTQIAHSHMQAAACWCQ